MVVTSIVYSAQCLHVCPLSRVNTDYRNSRIRWIHNTHIRLPTTFNPYCIWEGKLSTCEIEFHIIVNRKAYTNLCHNIKASILLNEKRNGAAALEMLRLLLLLLLLWTLWQVTLMITTTYRRGTNTTAPSSQSKALSCNSATNHAGGLIFLFPLVFC